VNEQQLLFMDFEFTMAESGQRRGFVPEIIEAGIVVVREGKIVEQFSSFVQPKLFPKLTERCKTFLKISQEQVNHGITFEELYEQMKKWDEFGPSRIVTWGNMDMKVLRDHCEREEVPFPLDARFIDLSMEYKRFFGDRNQTGLWKAIQEYGKEGVGHHHRALDDALTTYHIYRLFERDKQYLKKSDPPTIGDRVDLQQILNYISFGQ
jgi:sporulation inhibitor KapD